MLQRLFSDLRSFMTGRRETPQSRTEPGRVEEKVIPATSSQDGRERSPSRERVAIHAYHRWLSRGKPIGTEWEDWFEAERQLHPTL